MNSESNRRGTRRFPCLSMAVVIELPSRRKHSCVLKDISSGGARLVGHRLDHVQRELLLVCPPIRDPIACHVAWRKTNMIGVTFHSSLPIEDGEPEAAPMGEARAPIAH